MNLTFHQFRKDVRQFRVILTVWLVLLFLDLAANLGWVGSGKSSLQWENGSVANFVVWLQEMCLWLLFFLIPTGVVLTDSPGHREGFLRTRPMSGVDLWLAKTLFVLALVILPAVLQEGLYLAISGLPAVHVLHGVGDRLLYGLPIVVIATAFASLWRGYAQWSRGLGLAFAGSIVAALLLNLILYLARYPDLLENTTSANASSCVLAALYASALAALVVALAHTRLVLGPVGRWLGIAAAILTYVFVAMYWPWDLITLRPADPAAAQAVVSQAPLTVPPENVQLTEQFDKKWEDRLDFATYISPEDNRAIFPNRIEWQDRQVQLVNASGQSFPPIHPPDASAGFRNWGNPPVTDLRIWSGLLPKEVFFRLDQNLYNKYSANFGEFKVDRHLPWLRELATLKARVEGRVYRWEQVADFTLGAPASIKDAHGAWSYLELRPNDRGSQPYLLLKRSQISFSTASDPRMTSFGYDPRDRYDFVIYNPRRNVALVTDDNSFSAFTTRARATALSQYWMQLGIGTAYQQNWKSYTGEELAQCHLLIFEKNWLGTVPAEWQSPAFVINDLLAPGPAAQNPAQDGLAPGELERRLAELALPGAQASREEVCRYLVQAVPIMDASRNSHTPGDAVINRLATLVPNGLDVLIEGLPAMGLPSRSAVIEAIAQGASETQKTRVIAALPTVPDLIHVLFERGWVADAHEAIYHLMDGTKALSYETIQAIAWFHDPGTYPRLSASLEAHPSPAVYDVLRQLPGIDGPLAASVARMWQSQDPIVPFGLGEFEPALSLALHAGNPDALRLAYRLLAETRATAGQDNWGLVQVFRENFKMDGLKIEDQNNQRVMDWARKHTPDSFVFDPVRQRFVLKS